MTFHKSIMDEWNLMLEYVKKKSWKIDLPYYSRFTVLRSEWKLGNWIFDDEMWVFFFPLWVVIDKIQYVWISLSTLHLKRLFIDIINNKRVGKLHHNYDRDLSLHFFHTRRSMVHIFSIYIEKDLRDIWRQNGIIIIIMTQNLFF